MAEKKTKEEKKSYSEELAALRKELAGNTNEESFVSTGSLTLDIALGGYGWKCGKIAELVAWFGSGKTTLALETVTQFQKLGLKTAYFDQEYSLDKKYAQNIGVNWKEFEETLFQCPNGESTFETAKRLIQTGEIKLVVFDSTSGMLPQKQMEGVAGESYLGKHAELFSKQIPIINSLAARYNCLCIFISQIREKPGIIYGSPECTPAGHSLSFFDDYRIEIRKALEKENGDKEDATGVTSKFKIVKNKISAPYKTGEYSIKFGVGIDKIKEIIDIASELEILYKRGQVIKINPDTSEEEKYELPVFMEMLKDNPEFYSSLKEKILKKLNLI